jgi:methylenetetrahydrofolate reductase (NADPH)
VKTIRDALNRSSFAITAELGISPAMNAVSIVEQAKALSKCTDAIQIPDHRHARPHISNLAIAAHLLKDGIDPIVQMNCRDRNRIAIQSDLLGAQSLGVSGLLLMRGRRLPVDHVSQATGVYDISAIDLIRSAAAIRDGTVLAGGNEPDQPEFHIGAVASVFKVVDDWEPETLRLKSEAGAQFIQLQICMNLDTLRGYLARLVEAKLTWRCQLLAQVAVFSSADEALTLRKSISDAIVPIDVVKRLEDAKNPQQEGIRICAEQLQQLAEISGITGATVMAPGDPKNIVAAIEASGIRANSA